MTNSPEKEIRKSKTMRNPQVVSVTFIQDNDESRTNEVRNLIAQMILLDREKSCKNEPDEDGL